LYRVVAGRNCPVAASLSSQAYVAIPGLSEQSNRILAMVIARQVEDSSCGKVLREILNAEGIVPRVPGHSSAGFTARPGSSTVSPLATPPTAPVDRTPAAVRSWKPPTVPTPMATPAVAKSVRPAVPVTPPPRPAEAVPPSSLPTQVPQRLPKEPVPAVSEVKVESKRAIEPPVPIPVSKAPASEIVPKPVEARPKDALAKPIEPTAEPIVKETSKPVPAQARAKDSVPAPEVKTPPKKTVSKPAVERSETPPIRAPTVAKEKTDAETKSEPRERPSISTEPAPAEEKILVPADNKKGDRPPLVTTAPFVLPTPPQPVVISKQDTDAVEPRFQVSFLWQDPKFRWIGIGIAALLVLSVSYATFRPPSSPQVTTAEKPSSVVPAPQVSHPSPLVVQPVVNPPPVAVSKPSQPPPRPSVAGHYVGQVQGQQASGSVSTSFDREISIDSGLTSGYLIDYGSDPTKKIQLADSHVDPEGVYTASVPFSSATDNAHNDENLTVRRGENGLEVSFTGRQTSGAEYTLEGVLHPWTEADQARYGDLIAAMQFTPPPLNPQIPDKGQGGTKARRTASAESAPKGGGEHQTNRSQASEVAARRPPAPAAAANPPPAQARSVPRAPAAPKTTTERRTQTDGNKPPQPFKGTNPGG
jgi:hypothetical protein